jgi:hypothetical protein
MRGIKGAFDTIFLFPGALGGRKEKKYIRSVES